MSSTAIAIGVVIAIIAYGVGVFILSHRASKTINGNNEEFFVGGRGVGYAQLIGTMIMSLMSVVILVGYPPNVYRLGIGYWSGKIGCFMLGGIYLVTTYRLWLLSGKYHYVTPVDFFAHRYNSKGYGYLAAAVFVICIIPYISVQVSGVAAFITSSTSGKIGYWVVAFVFLAYILFHTIWGGNKSVTQTDALAGYVAVAVVLTLVLVISVKALGGTPMAEVVAAIKAGPKADVFTVIDPYNTTLGILGLTLAVGGSVLTWPHFMQRAFMAKNEKVMHASAVAIPLAYLLIEAGIYFLDIYVAPYVFPNWTSAEAEALTSNLINEFAPGLAILACLGVFAFAMSTADSFAVTATSLVQSNILHTPIDKQVKNSKIWLCLIMFVVLIVTYFQPPILVTYAYQFSAPGFAQLMPALFFGLFWKRANKKGALAGLAAGFAMVVYTNFIDNPFGLHVILCGLFANIIVFVIVSLLTKPDEKAYHEILEPLKRHFATRKSTSHKVWIVYTTLCYLSVFFVLPYLPDTMVGGWLPVVVIAQISYAVLFAISAFWYGKIRLYEKDGSTKELDIPDRYEWKPESSNK